MRVLACSRHGDEELFLAFEMVKDRPLGGSCDLADVLHGGLLEPLVGEQDGGGVADGFFFGHVKSRTI